MAQDRMGLRRNTQKIMSEVKPNEYQCEMCGGVFKKKLTDAEATEQFHQEFKGVPVAPENLAIVCDECYQELRSSMNN